MCLESYEKDYQAFYESSVEEENENTISMGMEILNTKKYHKILEENPEDKAQILYSIGNAYFSGEDYQNAQAYYQEATAEDAQSVYYRDQVAAQVKAGDLKGAQRTLEEAKRQGFHDEELSLAEQETAYAGQDMEKTEQMAQELSKSSKSDIAGYSCLLGAKACRELGQYDKQAEYLEKAYRLGNDKRCLRELGSTYLEAAQSAGGKASQYLKRAEECYEKLQKSYAVSYRDQMNLAIIKERLGEYKASEKILKGLKDQYTEEYEIYMHLAYVCVKQEEKLPEDKRDYTKAEGYYQKASQRYQKAGSPPDNAMAELSEYFDQWKGGS